MTTRNFETLAKSYLQRFQTTVNNATSAGASSTEMATRPIVHNFIENLVRLVEPTDGHCIVHHEISVTKSNRPDWRLEDRSTFGIYAYGDHKDLNERGSYVLSQQDRSQFGRYLALGRPVFIFDGVEFIFLDPTCADPLRNPIRSELIQKTELAHHDWSTLPVNSSIETHFRKLLVVPGFRKWSESELMEQLAQRARFISDVVLDLLTAPIGSGQDTAEESLIEALHQLREQLAQHHDPSLDNDQTCADFVAQALIFGIFFAHTQAPEWGDTAEQRRCIIRSFWTETSYLETAQKLRPFHVISTLLSSVLSTNNSLHAWYEDAASLLAHAEYIGTAATPTDFHTLFERFLAAFKPEMRFDYGAWYTPKELTHWMVRFADALSCREFGANLAEAVDKVIDPCVGTGGFLEAFIKYAAEKDGNPAELIGLEILPAPYALAQYRLAETAKGTRFKNHIQLFLTDTLSDQITNPPKDIKNGFDEEVVEASRSTAPPLRLVIGNPPSSGSNFGAAPRDTIESLLNDFRPPIAERSARQNTQKAINNEAYRFLRWSAERVLATDFGILALVLPGSFLHTVSLRHARAWLQRNFDQIWILEIDGDIRTGTTTESLFNVQQGRAAIFAVRGAPRKGLFYHNIVNEGLAEKREYLQTLPILKSFQELTMEIGVFAPRRPYPESIWNSCWPLTATTASTGIFRAKCSGIKLAPTSLLFHTDQHVISRRSRAIAQSPFKPWSQILESWFRGQRKPPQQNKVTDEVRQELGKAATQRPTSLVPYSYRPFVEGVALIDDAVFETLSRTAGAGTRARPEIRAAYDSGAVAICVAPAPRDLGSSLTRFASFAWHLPDNDNAARGNAMIYSDRFPHAATSPETPTSLSNIADPLLELFSFDANPDRAIVFYVYAILCCPSYLDEFEAVLYVSSDPQNPCRIPIARDENLRRQLTRYGKKIALYETEATKCDTIETIKSIWPSSLTSFKLKTTKIDVDGGSLHLVSDDGSVPVVIHGITARCLSERIAGHDVIAKWMRERTFAYLRREFRKSDFEHLLNLLTRITKQHQLIDVADSLVAKLIEDGPSALVSSPTRS